MYLTKTNTMGPRLPMLELNIYAQSSEIYVFSLWWTLTNPGSHSPRKSNALLI